MKYKNFEDFLMSKHSENYMGTDDDMPDAFSNWSQLDYEQMCEYADEYAKIVKEEDKEKIKVEVPGFEDTMANLDKLTIIK